MIPPFKKSNRDSFFDSGCPYSSTNVGVTFNVRFVLDLALVPVDGVPSVPVHHMVHLVRRRGVERRRNDSGLDCRGLRVGRGVEVSVWRSDSCLGGSVSTSYTGTSRLGVRINVWTVPRPVLPNDLV